jgi:hypothetical protein
LVHSVFPRENKRCEDSSLSCPSVCFTSVVY